MAASAPPLVLAEESLDNNQSQNALLPRQSGSAYVRLKIDPNTLTQETDAGVLRTELVSDSAFLSNDTGISRSSPDAFVLSSLDISGEGASTTLQETDHHGRYNLSTDDPLIKDILRRNVERQDEAHGRKTRLPFRDFIFTKQFTAFDRQNPATASSPFHGFFTMFWLGVFLLLVKLAADNWRAYGNIIGPSELLEMMFDRELLVMGVTDIVLCSSTVFCLVLQKAVLAGYLSWDKSGWVIQNIWQTIYIGTFVGWSVYRRWPWSHSFFILIHCLVMLMKQHSYAFYNGHYYAIVSELYKRKEVLGQKLEDLEQMHRGLPNGLEATSSTEFASSYLGETQENALNLRHRAVPSEQIQESNGNGTGIASLLKAVKYRTSLQPEDVLCLRTIIESEIDAIQEELKAKCTDSTKQYPFNLTFRNFAQYIPFPTVVYELEYPRQDHIDWYYVAEKVTATFGVLVVMNVISQAYIYPVVVSTVRMAEAGMSVGERLKELPWVIIDLLLPLMIEHLLAWYVVWDCVLNLLAELTYFADRGFYSSWWNSTSFDQYARDWNRPVHNFLLRHVYHSSIAAFHLSKPAAMLATFFLSALVHELVMWCLFRKVRGYLIGMQMLQLPLVGLAKTKWMRQRKLLGNVIFWFGIITGPSCLCSLYLIT
ncbi:acyl-CoA/sterol acyltransferase [Xylographa trunciseda]|nr:acyl-CoA/sterol acyltransferase [Xylographa trunciseda]